MKRFSLKVLNTVVLTGLLALPISAIAAEDLSDLLVKKGTITKEEADSVQKRSIASFVDKIKLSGDLRIREESQWYSGTGQANDAKNVNRQRLRLRIGSDIQEGLTIVHIRLASGTGQQVSTNQNFTGLSSQKSIWIDRAYIELKQIPNTSVLLGRMANPFFNNLSSELVWDDDYNPEGFAEQYSAKVGSNLRVFANVGQIVLDSSNGATGHDGQWLFGYQAGTELKADPVGFNVAVLYYNLFNGTHGTFSQSPVQDGNTRLADKTTLANSFNVIDGTAAVTLNAGIPLTIAGELVKNLADTVQSSALGIKNKNSASLVGLKIGNAAAANTYEFALMYESIDTDATLADLNFSDFGPNGGTNRKGYIVWVAYNLTDATQFKLKYYNSKIKDDKLLPAPVIPVTDVNPTNNRIQVDFSVKF
jgi:hypothetical protein